MTTTETATADAAEATRFLQALDPRPNAVFHFQTTDDLKARGDPSLTRTRVGVLTEHFAELERLNRRGAAVFVGVSEFAGSKRTVAAYRRARAVVVDLDGEPVTTATALRPSPTLIVRTSPDRFHCFWPLDLTGEPVAADVLKGMMITAAKACHGDLNIADVARAMRLPGFFHMKRPSAPHMVRVVLDKDERYPLADLMRLFPPDGTRSKAVNSSSGEEGRTSPEHLAEALAVLDPHEFSDYGEWFALLCACHHATAGKGRDAFFEWSQGDERYRGHENNNAQMWRGVDQRGYSGRAITTGTLVHALRLGGHRYEADLVRFGWSLGVLDDAGEPPAWLKQQIAADSWRDHLSFVSEQAPPPAPRSGGVGGLTFV